MRAGSRGFVFFGSAEEGKLLVTPVLDDILVVHVVELCKNSLV